METGKKGGILDSPVEITKHKDVELLEITLSKTIYELFEAIGVSLFRILKGQNKAYSVISISESGISLVQKKEDIAKVAAPFRTCFEEVWRTGNAKKISEKDREIEVRPIVFRKAVVGFLAITLKPGNVLDDNVISGFLSVYENYHELLMDYQNDTLTGLLNRRTFEGRLYHLMDLQLKEKATSEHQGSKRKNPEPSWEFWL